MKEILVLPRFDNVSFCNLKKLFFATLAFTLFLASTLTAQQLKICDGTEFTEERENDSVIVRLENFPSFELERSANCERSSSCSYSVLIASNTTDQSNGDPIVISDLCGSIDIEWGQGSNSFYESGNGYDSVFRLRSWAKYIVKTSAGSIHLTTTRYFSPDGEEKWSYWDGEVSGETLLQDIVTHHISKNF